MNIVLSQNRHLQPKWTVYIISPNTNVLPAVAINDGFYIQSL